MKQPRGPQFLDEFIGQERVKARARIAVGAALQRERPLPHALLTSSGGGLGKTAFARILANEMHRGIIQASGPAIQTVADVRRPFMKLDKNWVLHIDEIHAIGRKPAEELLLILEENATYIVSEEGVIRCDLPPFTVIASTTRPAKLSGPLRQRFGLHFHFDFYAVDELTLIAKDFCTRSAISSDDDVCRAIARCSLGVPRICRTLVERVRDVAAACNVKQATMKELDYAMQLEGIDPLGLNPHHRKLLEKLRVAEPRPVSAGSLAKALGEEQATVTEVLEPPLIRLGLVTIGPGGRRITQDGVTHLQSVADAHLTSIPRAKAAPLTSIPGGER